MTLSNSPFQIEERLVEVLVGAVHSADVSSIPWRVIAIPGRRRPSWRRRRASEGTDRFVTLVGAAPCREKRSSKKPNPQGRAANLDLDPRCARTALVFRHTGTKSDAT